MCDCKGALRAMETAWRGGGVEELKRSKRGGILEAICRLRAKLEIVVFMYVPAHRGVSMSAYADAVAKDYLQEEMSEGVAGWLRKILIEEREGRDFGYELGGGEHRVVAPWHDSIFEMSRDAVGAWVRKREAERVNTGLGTKGTVIVDTKRLGLVDTERNGEWWGDVMRKTGTAQVVERGSERTEGQAEEEAGKIREDNARCGLGAAMRNGGEIRQATQGKRHEGETNKERERGEWGEASRREAQGCPACCSACRGWGWRREDTATGKGQTAGEGIERIWRRYGEQTGPVRADTKHIVGGRCRAVEAADGGRKRALGIIAQLKKGIQEKVKEPKQKRQGKGKGSAGTKGETYKIRAGLEEIAVILDGARATMAGEATEKDREDAQWQQWRQLLAGAMPKPGEELGERDAKKAAKMVSNGIIALQREVTSWIKGWETAGKVETAQRREEDVNAEWEKGWFWAWRMRYLSKQKNKGSGGGTGGGRRTNKPTTGHTARQTRTSEKHSRARTGETARSEIRGRIGRRRRRERKEQEKERNTTTGNGRGRRGGDGRQPRRLYN